MKSARDYMPPKPVAEEDIQAISVKLERCKNILALLTMGNNRYKTREVSGERKRLEAELRELLKNAKALKPRKHKKGEGQ